MNVTECRKTLRSIRRYKADPVDHSIIDSVVLSASFSPFRKNTHVTRCIAIEDKVLLSEIAEKYTPDHNSKIILQSPLMSAATLSKFSAAMRGMGFFGQKERLPAAAGDPGVEPSLRKLRTVERSHQYR